MTSCDVPSKDRETLLDDFLQVSCHSSNGWQLGVDSDPTPHIRLRNAKLRPNRLRSRACRTMLHHTQPCTQRLKSRQPTATFRETSFGNGKREIKRRLHVTLHRATIEISKLCKKIEKTKIFHHVIHFLEIFWVPKIWSDRSTAFIKSLLRAIAPGCGT